MTVELKNHTNEKSFTIFNGMAPTTFNQAADLFELSMPTVEFLQRKDV